MPRKPFSASCVRFDTDHPPMLLIRWQIWTKRQKTARKHNLLAVQKMHRCHQESILTYRDGQNLSVSSVYIL